MKSLKYLGKLKEAKQQVAINQGGLNEELLFGILEVLAEIREDVCNLKTGITLKPEQLTKQQIIDILKVNEDEKELSKLTKEQLIEKLK